MKGDKEDIFNKALQTEKLFGKKVKQNPDCPNKE